MDRTELSPHATDWEELAELDPLWALHPIRMLHVPRDEVERWVRAAGARVVAVDVAPNQIGRSGTFYVTRA